MITAPNICIGDFEVSIYSGAGVIFGATGGVTEAAVRRVVKDKSPKALKLRGTGKRLSCSGNATAGTRHHFHKVKMFLPALDLLQNEVAFWEKQKENLKNKECDSVEEIAEKLKALHSYEDEIAAVKKSSLICCTSSASFDKAPSPFGISFDCPARS